MAQQDEPIEVTIGGTVYRIDVPINLDIGMRVADAIEAFAAADIKIVKREPKIWRALMDKRSAAVAIVSGALIRAHPTMTIQAIRDQLPTIGDASDQLIAAAAQIVARSGYFSDETLKEADRLNAQKAAEAQRDQGEAAPAQEPAAA